MSDNPIRKLVRKMETPAPPKRTSKANRTLSLNEPQFTQFQAHCKRSGRTASEVVDELISMYMHEVAAVHPQQADEAG